MKTKIKGIVTILVLTIIISSISPLFSYAKENNFNKGRGTNKEKRVESYDIKKSGDDNKDEYENEKINSSTWFGCMISGFGHLIAPGWIKKNGNIEINDNCNLPFGIGRHIDNDDDNDGTSTPSNASTSAPVISSVSITNITDSSAKISWLTDKLSTSKIWYGTTTPNLSTSTNTTVTGYNTSHTVGVYGLNASTTYYVVIQSNDLSGNIATSSVFSFNTSQAPVVTPVAPIISNIVAYVGTSTIGFTWNTDVPANSKVFYSKISPVDLNSTSTMSVSTSTLTTNHNLTVTDLSTSTKYYFILRSVGENNSTTTSNQFDVTTSY